ncbi:ABC transporter ATP-binding protein [Peptostreptococcus anaerobius]|uniref:ABC transporter ATP-binding protein n=1 Tax=Peptostreptococcus porci TaxID=2652282 RepID=A0A6N7XFC6_9FIRM|nr:ABC transporter ATP-binding protein [Peptostreptococcus porci]MST61909.1 ABC transporter ATP-binding protein [Peptostreptococcus porci]
MENNRKNFSKARKKKRENENSSVKFFAVMKRLLKYADEDRMKVLYVFVFSIISTVFTIVGPKILGNATTEIFNGVIRKINNINNGIDFSYILKIVLILLLLYVISSVFSYLQSYVMSSVALKISYRLRKEISEKFNRLPISYYDNNERGEIISRVTNDVDTLSQSLNQSLVMLITSVITVIGVFIMMLSINLVMTIFSLLMIPLIMIVMSMVIRKSQHFFSLQQKYLGRINSKIEESFSGQNVIRGYNAEKFEQLDFNKTNNKLYNSAWKSQFLSSVMMPVMVFIGNLGYVMIAIMGGYMTISGKIAVGDIQAFIQYMRSFTQPLNQIAQIMNMFQSTVAAAERVFEFLDQKELDFSSTDTIDEDKFEGHIEFSHVDFGYDKNKMIIRDFNLDVKPGQKIAIVGPTGAGKTTLVKLLMRFYDINSGNIYLDGKDIYSIDIESYRKNFAMVLQDTWLFSGTIMENLKYGNLSANDEDVYRAAKAAYADRFILTQKNGYDTVLSEDTKNISQGQKQLLTIARAILSNPKILILDEATSSVDTRTEQMIQRAMDNLVKNRTSFIIAHRLSTIKNADLILVIKDGNIVESGTHEELMEMGNYYRSLYNSQYENLEEIN